MLTANIGSNLGWKFGTIQAYTAGAPIFRGATVAIRLTDGKAYPAVEDLTDEFKQLIVGISMEAATAGATIRVRREGKIRRKFPGVSVLAVGKLACIKDDETVQTFHADECKVVMGRITEVGGGECFVDLLDRPVRIASSLYE